MYNYVEIFHLSKSFAINNCFTGYNTATRLHRPGRQGVHALFVDFLKAFDLVDHKILLDKLADMNVTRSFWLWIRSFLEGRTQQVNLQSVLSFTASCPAGVRQGFAISPTLFNIHINDMEENVYEQACVNTTKYADECTMDTSIRTGESSDLQSALPKQRQVLHARIPGFRQRIIPELWDNPFQGGI
jgi:hypothetical protein